MGKNHSTNKERSHTARKHHRHSKAVLAQQTKAKGKWLAAVRAFWDSLTDFPNNN